MIIPGPKARSVVVPLLNKHQIDWETVLSRSRKNHIVMCRHEIFMALKRELRWSGSRIAKFCNKDHTTVGYVFRKNRDR